MDSLPNELLLHVIRELDYFDLKFSLPLVSKRFNHLLCKFKNTQFIDRKLFRDIPRGDNDPKRQKDGSYKLHPAFKNLWYIDHRPDQLYKLTFDGHWGGEVYNGTPLQKCPLRLENAVSPSVRKLKLHMRNHGLEDITGTGAGGSVTVWDVMKALLDDPTPQRDSHNSFHTSWEYYLEGLLSKSDTRPRDRAVRWEGIQGVVGVNYNVYVYVYGWREISTGLENTE